MNKPGVYCHTRCPSPPANHPDRDKMHGWGQACSARQYTGSAVAMWIQMEVANCFIKALEERKRNFWSLYLVNQRKTLPLRAWPEEGFSYIFCPVCSNNAEHFIDHPGRLFTYLSFPCSIWRIVVLSLWGRCVENTVNSTDWAPNSSRCLYEEDLRSLNNSHSIKKKLLIFILM